MTLFRPATLTPVVLFLGCLLGTSSRAHAQPPPPGPGVSRHDTNNDGTVDLTVRRIDTNGDGVTDRIHIDADNDGVVDGGERVFDNVVGLSIIGGAGGFTIIVLEDTGTERVQTRLVPFDSNGDGDCDDAGEIRQVNFMPDSTASIRLRLPDGRALDAQLNGQSQFEADLNSIFPSGGRDAIPIELVALSLRSADPANPIAMDLLEDMPSRGLLVEDDNPIPGHLDGQRFAAAGTFDLFFDVFFTIDVAGLQLFNPTPLMMSGLNGAYPPDLGQMFLNGGPVPLFDRTTGRPTGIVLEQFTWTPHSALRLDCDCSSMTIQPLIRTHKTRTGQTILDSPKASGAISGADPKVYEVEIAVEWNKGITCKGPGVKCVGTYAPSAKSDGWKIDGKKSAPAGVESHTGGGALGNVVCNGNCDDLPLSVNPPPTTTYKVSVKKGSGGVITDSVTGVVTLSMAPVDCLGNPWTMILVYEAKLKGKKLEVSINQLLSDWDGDKKINAADRNPLDPSKP